MSKHVLRASEVGLFAYCERAWGYRERGEASRNVASLAGGEARHRARAAAVVRLRAVIVLAVLMIAASVVLATLQLAGPGG